jgi:hypothetical protein
VIVFRWFLQYFQQGIGGIHSHIFTIQHKTHSLSRLKWCKGDSFLQEAHMFYFDGAILLRGTDEEVGMGAMTCFPAMHTDTAGHQKTIYLFGLATEEELGKKNSHSLPCAHPSAAQQVGVGQSASL